MNSSLTVFICGTYSDFTNEREGVLNAIRKLQLQHDSMEFFGARTNQAIETCLDEVRRSDVLVVIVGHLYGSLVPEMGVSFTEAEYRAGYSLGKPCLIYMRDENVPILPKNMERNPKKLILLKKFKEMLKKRHTVATFCDSPDLSVMVAADLSRVSQELKAAAIVSLGQHLAILNQGIDTWNAWRVKTPKIVPDLKGADLNGLDLSSADFRQTDLTGANLRRTTLLWTNFSGASLNRADVTDALFGETIFGNTDLTDTAGLEVCKHAGPSTIDIRTVRRSKGLPLSFLRGCQLSDTLIEYLSAILAPPIDFYSCFISYSTMDQEFAERLYADLQNAGVRCWFAPQDLKIGDKVRSGIAEVIRIHDKLILVISNSSMISGWVEKEVETAMEQEQHQKRTVLFPIRLDDAVMKVETGWPADVRRSRNIGDFRKWKQHDDYQKAFQRLLRDLMVDRQLD